MKSIKFRAWLKGEMLNDANLYNNRLSWVSENGYECFSCLSNVDDAVLMQFTGLKDKNGVELYHGDIINVGGELSQILCENGFLHFFFWCEKLGEYTSLAFLVGYKSFEIVGNIYQNPELITQE